LKRDPFGRDHCTHITPGVHAQSISFHSSLIQLIYGSKMAELWWVLEELWWSPSKKKWSSS